MDAYWENKKGQKVKGPVDLMPSTTDNFAVVHDEKVSPGRGYYLRVDFQEK